MSAIPTVNGPASGTRSRTNSTKGKAAGPASAASSSNAEGADRNDAAAAELSSTMVEDSVAESVDMASDSGRVQPKATEAKAESETGHLLPLVNSDAASRKPDTVCSSQSPAYPPIRRTNVPAQLTHAPAQNVAQAPAVPEAVHIQPPTSAADKPNSVQYRGDVSLIELQEVCSSRCYSPAAATQHITPSRQLTNPDICEQEAFQRPLAGMVSPISIPIFTGQEDVHVFTQQIKDIAAMAHWDDSTTKYRLKFALQGMAGHFYLSRPQYEKRDYSYHTILKELEENFHSPQAQFVARAQLHQRSQQPRESVEVFAYSIRELALRADPHVTDEALGQTLLNGLTPQIQSAVFLQLQTRNARLAGSSNNFTFAEVLDSARIVEASQSLLQNRMQQPMSYVSVNELSTAGTAHSSIDAYISQQAPAGVLAQVTSLTNEVRDLSKMILSIGFNNRAGTQSSTPAGNQQQQEASQDPRRQGRPFPLKRNDYSRPPNTPCPLCNDPNNLHWKFQCPLLLQAKALAEERRAKQQTPSAQGPNSNALPSKNGQTQ